jgi:hypothetical protein
MFIIHDTQWCQDESDPPENAIVVFHAPVEVESHTKVFLIGPLTALVALSGSISQDEPSVFRFGGSREKMAHIKTESCSLVNIFAKTG